MALQDLVPTSTSNPCPSAEAHGMSAARGPPGTMTPAPVLRRSVLQPCSPRHWKPGASSWPLTWGQWQHLQETLRPYSPPPQSWLNPAHPPRFGSDGTFPSVLVGPCTCLYHGALNVNSSTNVCIPPVFHTPCQALWMQSQMRLVPAF